jgi:hypothetical protein
MRDDGRIGDGWEDEGGSRAYLVEFRACGEAYM